MPLIVKADTDACGVFKRLLVMVYDLLLLAALLMFSTLFVMGISGQLGGPNPAGPSGITPGAIWFQLFIMLLTWAFYAGFWTLSGQTLGLKTWRLRVVTVDGQRVPLWRSSLRFAVALLSIACAGLGFFWAWTNAQRRTWHDLASGTRVRKEAKLDY